MPSAGAVSLNHGVTAKCPLLWAMVSRELMYDWLRDTKPIYDAGMLKVIVGPLTPPSG